MTIQQADILLALAQESFSNQRSLSQRTGYSLGLVNRTLVQLVGDGYLTPEYSLTPLAREELERHRPRKAVILAAGFGMRMVPINLETPKALLEVDGEKLIHRQIRQLQEVGIRDITVVVGFLKEEFEYLIDTFGVKLVVNPHYARRNNLHSLARVAKDLGNAYIVPCDIWCANNPFRSRELYSWYMVSDLVDSDSDVRVNRKLELVADNAGGNAMVGIAYLTQEDGRKLSQRLGEMAAKSRWDDAFWEAALYTKEGGKEKMAVAARVVHSASVVEINTYEQLRDLDSDSDQLRSDAIGVICQALQAKSQEITDITVLKKGMTNRSFLFTCRGKKYIMRIPGEGTDRLINRAQEAGVYRVLDGLGICDNIAYINPENGYKITEYLENSRVCDPEKEEDLVKCMEKLRAFHGLGLQVEHTFDIFALIDFYESLWEGAPSMYRDYQTAKANALSLGPYIQAHRDAWTLTHIDAVPDNFLFAGEDLRLIDWEYAGMQDPHVDIAMFCIYSLYSRHQVDRLIDLYFQGGCPRETRIKIYCYISLCGLLWSNWCEYKAKLGVEFGEYSLRQYRFAKDYYRIAIQEMEKEGL